MPFSINKAKIYLFGKFCRHFIAEFDITFLNLLYRVKEIIFCFGHGVAGADELHLIAGGVVGYI